MFFRRNSQPEGVLVFVSNLPGEFRSSERCVPVGSYYTSWDGGRGGREPMIQTRMLMVKFLTAGGLSLQKALGSRGQLNITEGL